MFSDLAKKFEEREKEFQQEKEKLGVVVSDDKSQLLESQVEDLQDLIKSKQRLVYL